MKRKPAYVLGTLLSLLVYIAGATDAFAARMGGGRSFGSRPSYSVPYQRSPSPMSPGMNRPGSTAQQPGMSPAQQRNQTMRDSLAQRGGLSRFLGGMALGGLLGAMFFGGGFEHINFFDILMFGGIAYLLFRLFAARRQPVGAGAGYYGAPDDARTGSTYARQAANPGAPDFDTDIMSGRTGGRTSTGPNIPADFDAQSFLNGAQSAYRMMQKSWDDGDLAELRALTTDKVFAELQEQIRQRGGQDNQTELLQVDTELLEVRDVGADREVTVLFDVLMREAPGTTPAQVREVWHFVRARNSRQPTWFLDGIQQLED